MSPLLAALLAAAALQTPPSAPGAHARPSRPPCIQLSAGSSTEYTPVDDHTIVVRSFNDWWKLTTTPSTLMLQPDTFLLNDVHGPSTLCSRLDFQLSVIEHPNGVREGLIVQDFQAITPQEGRALRTAAHR